MCYPIRDGSFSHYCVSSCALPGFLLLLLTLPLCNLSPILAARTEQGTTAKRIALTKWAQAGYHSETRSISIHCRVGFVVMSW